MKTDENEVRDTKQRLIKAEDVAIDPSSYVDPQGFVFHYEGGLYRCIRPEAATLFRRLIDDGTLARLERERGLIPTHSAELAFIGDTDAMVVRHPLIWPLSYCVEWCPSMLRDGGGAAIRPADA